MKTVAFLCLALVATGVHAQDAPLSGKAASGDDIVVTGHPFPNRKEAEKFVGAITARSNTQIARFHQPLCPVVIGLPDHYAAPIAARIRSDAEAVGIPLAKQARCSANLIVMIVTDGAGFVREVRSKQPGWLNGLAPPEVDALVQPGPARAWTVASLRSEDGSGTSSQPGGAGSPLSGIPMLVVTTASIVNQSTRQDIDTSFVVIDEADTIGLSVRQIADYAAMRGLARTRPPEATDKVDTILSVFDVGAPNRPRGLTQADASYLKALYESPGTSSAVTERNRIARRLSKGD